MPETSRGWATRPPGALGAFTSAAAYTPQPLSNLSLPDELMADDGSSTIDIGFNVALYGSNYSVLAVDTNGLITFGPEPTTE